MNAEESAQSYRGHVDTCDWLVAMVRDLPDAEFLFAPIGGVNRERKRIVDMLELDTSFKLISALESDLKRDLQETVGWGGSSSEPLSVEYLGLWTSWSGRYASTDVDRFLRYTRFEDMLDVIRKTLSGPTDPLADACSFMKARYNSFRHWDAHGRRDAAAPYVPKPADIADNCECVVRGVIRRAGRT